MHVEQLDAADHFTGIDSDGGLYFPNGYACVGCGYGVIFSTGALANASAYRWQGSRGSKLKDVFVGVFDEEEVRFCGDNPERFIVDFHCPKCALATGIGFERYEFHMAAYKYRPLCVWIANP